MRVAFPVPSSDKLGLPEVHRLLFAFFFARQRHGTFILFTPDANPAPEWSLREKRLLQAIRWLEISYDEGLERGGSFFPYRQSEAFPIYEGAVLSLLKAGKAYPCICPSESPVEVCSCRNRPKERRWKPHLKAGEKIRFHTVVEETPPPGRKKSVTSTSAFPPPTDFLLWTEENRPSDILAHAIDWTRMKMDRVIREEKSRQQAFYEMSLLQALGEKFPVCFFLPDIRESRPDSSTAELFQADWEALKDFGILPEVLRNVFVFGFHKAFNDGLAFPSLSSQVSGFRPTSLPFRSWNWKSFLRYQRTYLQQLPIKVLKMKVLEFQEGRDIFSCLSPVKQAYALLMIQRHAQTIPEGLRVLDFLRFAPYHPTVNEFERMWLEYFSSGLFNINWHSPDTIEEKLWNNILPSFPKREIEKLVLRILRANQTPLKLSEVLFLLGMEEAGNRISKSIIYSPERDME